MRPVIWSFGSFLFSAAPKKHWHSQFFASPLATPFPCLHDFPAQPRGGFSEKTLMDGQKGFPAKNRRGWMLYIYEPVKTLTPHTLPNLLISEERKRLSLAFSFSFSPLVGMGNRRGMTMTISTRGPGQKVIFERWKVQFDEKVVRYGAG